MMSIKMVAMDLDDTLLDADLHISPQNKAMIARATREGIRIILASGRMYRSIVPYTRELALTTPVIAYNGAMIQTPDDTTPLFHRPIPLPLTRELISELNRKKLHINLYLQDNLYVSHFNEKILDYANNTQVPFTEVGDLLSFMSTPPTKVIIISEPSELDKLISPLRSLFGQVLHITKSKPHYLEFLAPQVNKGTSLRFLREYYHLKKEEVMAIGDAPNDLEMIQEAGVGVAVANALSEVKTKADWIVASNVDNGVAQALAGVLS